MSINKKIILNTLLYETHKDLNTKLKDNTAENFSTDDWQEFTPLIFSEPIDFGELRGGYDDMRYKSMIVKIIKDITKDKNEMIQLARVFQIWGIKLNIHGARIQDDNFIPIGNKKFTAKDLAELLGYNRENKLGYTLGDSNWNKLTIFRFMRAYVVDSYKYLLENKAVIPNLKTQINIDDLPRELFFLNAIYLSEGKSYPIQLIKLAREFDIIMESVEKRVVSYEQRAVVTLQGLSSLEKFCSNRSNELERNEDIIVGEVIESFKNNPEININGMLKDMISNIYELYIKTFKSRRNLSQNQSNLSVFQSSKPPTIEELSAMLKKRIMKRIKPSDTNK